MQYIVKNSKGFTLIELLVVMAISVILMGLIMGPLVKSTEFTRQAQAMVQAQDSARFAMEQISRELSSAMFVYDNAYAMRSNTYSRSMIRIPIKGGTSLQLPYAQIDFVLPKMTMHCNSPYHPDNTPRDYPRGDDAWPSCPATHTNRRDNDNVEARPKLPLEQDATIVRYFLGLKSNKPSDGSDFDPTVDPPAYWQSPLDNNVEPGMENPVVLYRIEFNLNDESIFSSSMSMADRQAVISDPLFFYNSSEAADGVPYYKHWAQKARIVGSGKYEDLVTGTYDGNSLVALSPTVTFRMAQIDNDTFTGTYSSDKSFEYPDAVPTVYRAKYGYWTGSNTVSVYRNDYSIAYSTYVSSETSTFGHVIIKRWQQDGSNTWQGVDEFDITDYLQKCANGTLTAITKPGSNDVPEMAFTFDSVKFGDPPNAQVSMVYNRGVVNFALDPPNMPVVIPNTAGSGDSITKINEDFLADYAIDRGSAQRKYQIAMIANTMIVPGSEVITGPDMLMGSSGRQVKYQRVPEILGNAGLNQYKIDYKTGMVYFCSDYDQNIPSSLSTDQITIKYKIQFNKSGDVVRGDYGTKSLVNIHLGMRLYDPDTGKAFPVDLNNSVKIQNALR